ncbi:MAG: S8 family serine peptidase [Clostridiales bacterium]|nr:S8 family serine peptidase [Clostridiales bacterium]
MDTVQVIVECGVGPEKEKILRSLGEIKYALPMINSYVLELPKQDLHKLSGIKEIISFYKNTRITAQMNVARKTVKAEAAQKAGFTGGGVGIAILDTGVDPVDDLTKPDNRITAFKNFVGTNQKPHDDNGHGTHVAAICAGNGFCSGGKYMGIAPGANIIGVKILDEDGSGGAAEVLAGLQWMMDNAKRYNIRVCNLSIGTSEAGMSDPLVKAVNAAWKHGIVVVTAAGNNGPDTGSVTSPGISRKVITVGASDDHFNVQIWGDTLINFSGRGPTPECIVKPDVIAPGANITSCLSQNASMKRSGKAQKVSDDYIKMSGTSMSTPIVTGAVALLLQKHPNLSPDDVKFCLKKCAVSMNYSPNQQGWGLIDIEKLLEGDAVYARK